MYLAIYRYLLRFIRAFVFFILTRHFFLYIYKLMKIQNKKMFASILFVLISFVCVAQSGMPPPPAPPPPPGLPIDGGILAGLFIGIVIGVKKLLKR